MLCDLLMESVNGKIYRQTHDNILQPDQHVTECRNTFDGFWSGLSD